MRIPISSQDLLFGTKVHEYNIFFLFMVIFSPILVLGLRYRLRSMKDHHCGERLLQPGLFTAFIYLYSALFGCALATEHYWHLSCPVSTARFHVTTQIFQHNLAFLASSEWADTAFVAEGTMLAVVRERPNLNIWDQDSDIFVAIEAADETSVLQTLEKVLRCGCYWHDSQCATAAKGTYGVLPKGKTRGDDRGPPRKVVGAGTAARRGACRVSYFVCRCMTRAEATGTSGSGSVEPWMEPLSFTVQTSPMLGSRNRKVPRLLVPSVCFLASR